MQATLNLATKIIAYGDQTVSSNPRLRFVDWLRDMSGIQVSDPRSESHRLEVGATKTIFDGVRTTNLDGSHTFSISLLATEQASRYRLTTTSATDPEFRIGRALAGNTFDLTFTVNSNGTVTLVSSDPLFGSVVAGDEVFIPHLSTGDNANVISASNAGYWVVLSVSSTTQLVMSRAAGEDFEGVSETVTLTDDDQIRAYTAAGVQVGDALDISGAFSLAARRTFEVAAVTDAFIEFVSTSPLPDENGIVPTAGQMVVYEEIKSFLFIESSQEVAVRLNGDTGDTQRITPVDASAGKPGVYMKFGPAWSLTLVNRSSSAADVTIIHAQ